MILYTCFIPLSPSLSSPLFPLSPCSLPPSLPLFPLSLPLSPPSLPSLPSLSPSLSLPLFLPSLSLSPCSLPPSLPPFPSLSLPALSLFSPSLFPLSPCSFPFSLSPSLLQVLLHCQCVLEEIPDHLPHSHSPTQSALHHMIATSAFHLNKVHVNKHQEWLKPIDLNLTDVIEMEEDKSLQFVIR